MRLRVKYEILKYRIAILGCQFKIAQLSEKRMYSISKEEMEYLSKVIKQSHEEIHEYEAKIKELKEGV